MKRLVPATIAAVLTVGTFLGLVDAAGSTIFSVSIMKARRMSLLKRLPFFIAVLVTRYSGSFTSTK